MVGAGLTGVIGTPSTGCCIIKIATGVQVVSLGYNQLPPSINVLNSVSLSYDTYVRTKGAVGWVVVDQSAYLPLAGGALTGQVTTNQTPILSTQLVPKSYVDTFLPKSGGTMTGNIDMGAFGLTTTQSIFTSSNLVTRVYVDNAVATGGGAYVPLSGGTMTGALNMGNNAVNTTLATGSFTGNNLVSKNYTDATFTKCPSEQLKIIRGTVNASGGIVSGAGFSVVYAATGKNTITFSGNPFSGITQASIVATVLVSGSGSTAIVDTNSTTSTPQTCLIVTSIPGVGGYALAVPFSFIAIGT
jgi:hypothetical protein